MKHVLKRNLCFDVNGRFESTRIVTLYLKLRSNWEMLNSLINFRSLGASPPDPPYPVRGARWVGGVLRGRRQRAYPEAPRGGPRRRRLQLRAGRDGSHELLQVCYNKELTYLTSK